jgi:mRNA interferase RelE/StbE
MYQVKFWPRATRDIDKLDDVVAARVLKRIRWLAENFDLVNPESLTGEFAGLHKLRVGDYRVIYQADREKKMITILLIGHRREIYNQPI